MAFEYFVYEVL